MVIVRLPPNPLFISVPGIVNDSPTLKSSVIIVTDTEIRVPLVIVTVASNPGLIDENVSKDVILVEPIPVRLLVILAAKVTSL